jgi:GNAT superfamily N-acetyltransferase
MLNHQALGVRIYKKPRLKAVLFLGEIEIGSAEILEQDIGPELAYVRISEPYRHKGYGKVLINYLIYYHPAQKIYLTTIIPEYFAKLGFERLPAYPSFVDHTSAECQACDIGRCTAMVFTKPAQLTRFQENTAVYAEYISLIQEGNFMCSEYSVVNARVWSETENIYYTNFGPCFFFVLFPFHQKPFAVLLPCPKITTQLMNEFADFLRSINVTELRHVTNRGLGKLKALSRPLTITPDRDNFDYIYKVSDFANYAGRKYEKKRNRVKKFLKDYPDHKTQEYTHESKQLILDFARRIINHDLQIAIISEDALERALDHPQTKGFYVTVGGKIIAVLIYSELNPKTIIVHFEFIDSDYDGISQYINNYLGKILTGKYLFINREQDLGIEGLRRSKMDYRPYRLLRKYIITL